MIEEPKNVSASDIMNKNVISVFPDTPVLEAAKIISENGLDGVPVVDERKKIVGILTEYDLITKTSPINIGFIRQILTDIKSKNKDKAETIVELTVKQVMNPEPLTLKDTTPYKDVLQTFRDHHRVNPIPIVDEENRVVGVISRYDILRPLNILSHSTKN